MKMVKSLLLIDGKWPGVNPGGGYGLENGFISPGSGDGGIEGNWG